MKFNILIRSSIKWVALASIALVSACTTSPPQTPPTSSPTIPAYNKARIPAGQNIHPAGGTVNFTAVKFTDLPSWQKQNFSASLSTFRNSCIKLINQPLWQAICTIANTIPTDNTSTKAFFERYFTPWRIDDNGRLAGVVTGYYEPALQGSLTPTVQARYPIYGVPYDLVTINLPTGYSTMHGIVRVSRTGQNSGVISDAGNYTANLDEFLVTPRTRSIKGRFTGNQFIPYHTRVEINSGALNGKAPILAYANDPIELFFLQIQGSGRLETPDGQSIRLAFADKNGFPYQSIARYMVEQGYLPLKHTKMPDIQNWLFTHPNQLGEILAQNPSYIFFRILPDSHKGGPLGALGVPLTAGLSVAVDNHSIPLGAPIFVATKDPRNGQALNRLMMAQDTGSAIKGGVRIDFFWGYGYKAGQVAGRMKETGYTWLLLPNGMWPQRY